ncbi:MAG: hypothetical protein E6713_06105 [Sporomusaceae bacterium]|nr:hypothetical protein [Sporomusaceae bacterium]
MPKIKHITVLESVEEYDEPLYSRIVGDKDNAEMREKFKVMVQADFRKALNDPSVVVKSIEMQVILEDAKGRSGEC